MQYHALNGAEIIDIATWCRRARFARRAVKLRRNPDVIEAVTARALGKTRDDRRAAAGSFHSHTGTQLCESSGG